MLPILGKHRARFVSVFLVTFVLASCVPILLSMYFYTSQLALIYEDYENASVQTLKQCQELIDARFIEMNNITQQLSNDPTVNFLIASSGKFGYGPLTNDSRKIMSEMNTHKNTNSFFSDFFIYITSKDVLLSSEIAYTRLEEEYGKLFSMNDWDYIEFCSNLLSDSRASNIKSVLYRQFFPFSSSTPTKNSQSILFRQSFPINRTISSGCIFYLIPMEQLYEIFEPLTVGLGSKIYLLDKNGVILNSDDDVPRDIVDLVGRKSVRTETLNGEKTMVFSVYSNTTKITYVSVLPHRIVVNRVMYIRDVTIICSVVLLTLGILVAIYLARMASKPLLDIYERLMPITGEYEDEKPIRIKQITASVKALINRNTYLSELVEKQIPLLRHMFFMKLFRGDFVNEKAVDIYMEQINFKIPHGQYLAILVYIKQTTEHEKRKMRTYRVLIQEALSTLPCLFYLYDNDVNRFIGLFNVPDAEAAFGQWRKSLEKKAAKILEELPGNIQPLISMAGGMAVRQLIDLNLSVNAARQAMTYYNSEMDIVWYSEIYNKNYYKYPIDIENSLINLVCAGDASGISRQLDRLYQINFIDDYLSENAFTQLVFSMVGTIHRLIVERLKLDHETLSIVTEQIHEILGLVTVEDVWRCFSTIYTNLCSYKVGRMRTKNIEMIERAKKYLEEHYNDTQLNIHVAAQAVGTGAENLSFLFKDETGEYFSDYLEKLRMKIACDLLEKNQKIDIIAENVGYNSAHTFRRAFKRCMGINPSAYKKIE